MDLISGCSLKALEDCRMFGVYRKDLHTHFLCQRHDNVTGCDQCLLICQSNVFSCFHGSDGRPDTDHSHYCGNYDLCLWLCCNSDQALHTGKDLHIQIFYPFFQFFCLFFTPQAGDLRLKFADLFFDQIHIGTGCQSRYLNIFIVSYYL